MVELPAYPARFDFGRLFADSGRVLARAGLPLLIGVLVLGAAPYFISSIGWWRAPAGTTPGAFRTVWVAINLAKELIGLISLSATAVFVAAVSARVLSGATGPGLLRPAALATGFTTSLCLGVLVNWSALLSPLIVFVPEREAAVRFVPLIVATSSVVTTALVGLAVPVAVAEGVAVAPAIARSLALLRGLRWRAVSLSLAYFLLLSLCGWAMTLALHLAGLSYGAPGIGRAALNLVSLPLSALAQIIFVSFFFQARRISDGPSPDELHEVFA
jgi:hypothetical protein